MSKSLALIFVLILPFSARAISRRRFLQGTGATAVQVAAPMRTSGQFAAGPVTGPTLDDVYAQVLAAHPYPFTGAEGGTPVLAELWSTWDDWIGHRPHLANLDVWDRILALRDFSAVHPRSIARQRIVVQRQLKHLETCLSLEFNTEPLSVRRAIKLLNHPETILISALSEAAVEFGDLPLSDAFIRSYLRNLAEIHPDIACETMHWLTETLDLEVEDHLQILTGGEQSDWLPHENALNFEFKNLPANSQRLRALPETASAAWPHYEPYYAKAFAQLDRALERLGTLPESTLKMRALREISVLRSGLSADAKRFATWYPKIRSLLVPNATDVNLALKVPTGSRFADTERTDSTAPEAEAEVRLLPFAESVCTEALLTPTDHLQIQSDFVDQELEPSRPPWIFRPCCEVVPEL